MTTPNSCSNDSSKHELLDFLDASGKPLGTAPRAHVHRHGLWHAVFHCQIVAMRNGIPNMVLQRRHTSKLAFGGLLDVSAAGHLGAGETPGDGVRELYEEIGVRVDPCELASLGIRLLVDDEGEGLMNKEYTHIFLLRDDRPLHDYRLAHGEVDAVFEGAAADLLALFDKQTSAIELKGSTASGDNTSQRFTLKDFVPDFDYWITLAVMSERFGLGISPVAI